MSSNMEDATSNSCDLIKEDATATATEAEAEAELAVKQATVNGVLAEATSSSYPVADLDLQVEVDDAQPLSERWSPLGANYDDANSHSYSHSHSASSELLSPDCEADKSHLQPAESASSELARLRNIEDEQELLTSSLLALTSHFAHVQLRVRQIVEAPTHERDQLLRDLEHFAFQGIPDAPNSNSKADDDAEPDEEADEEAATAHDGQLIDSLKLQLTQLEQLAYDAGAPGVLPQHVMLEKQQFILDELRTKLNLQVEQHELPSLSTEQLRHQVDNAIGEFVGPLKMKEQLVAQLKTQITDLERFIAFLQCDAAGGASSGEKLKLLGAYNSYAAKQRTTTTTTTATMAKAPANPTTVATTTMATPTATTTTTVTGGESLQSKAHGLLDKASLLMQMFATTHFARRQADFQQNSLKKTHKGNHWGDLRAQLEVDIQEVSALAATLSCDREKLANIKRALRQQQQQAANPSSSVNSFALTTVPPRCRRAVAAAAVGHELAPYGGSGGAGGAAQSSDDSDEDAYERYDWDKSLGRRIVHMRGDSIATISRELTTVVRKNFARTLQQLMQHGLRVAAESATSSLMVPFMRCLHPSASSPPPQPDEQAGAGGGAGSGGLRAQLFGSGRAMHAWELVLEYYYLKHGDEYNNTPARKLSQSFQLDIVDAQAVTAKQSLLSAVGMIVAMHRPYKRSYNAHFKAFVCAGLNARLLVEWLNLILSCNELIDTYYAPSSYVARTGFRDSLRSIDALSKYDFDLPVDLAIRHFRNI